MDLLLILTGKSPAICRWQALFESCFKFRHFASFVNIYEYVYLEIFSKIKNNNSRLQIEEDHFKKIIFQHLGNILEQILGRILIFEFHLFRRKGLLDNPGNQTRFTNFINLIAQENFIIGFFNTYPVAGAKLTDKISQLLTYFTTLLQYLQSDFATIVTTIFSINNQSYVLSDIIFVGDMHNGKCVSKLKFIADGKKYSVIYKPHNIQTDIAFTKLIDWVNSEMSYCFKYPKYLSMQDHGWVEYIKYSSCKNATQIADYYYRFGGLLFLMHCLHATDVNWSNLIACGEYPVIIDLECLLTPVYTLNKDLKFQDSKNLVIYTAMLPHQRMVEERQRGVDKSAYGAMPKQLHPYRRLKLIHPGKDTIRYKRLKRTTNGFNIPKLNGNLVDPALYSANLIQGFADLYAFFIKKKEFLLSDLSPLRFFNGCETRIVFKNTSEYSQILYESNHPQLLVCPDKYRNYLSKSYQINKLTSVLLPFDLPVLGQDCIPKYVTNTAGNFIKEISGVEIPVYISQSGLTRVKNYICSDLNEKDRYIQINLIKQTLKAYLYNRGSEIAQPQQFAFTPKKDVPNLVKFSIAAIANHLEKLVIISKDEIYWTSLNLTTNNILLPVRTNSSLYNGVAGIILTMSYLPNHLKTKKIRQMIEIGARKILQILNAFTDQISLPITVGYKGAMGLVYVLVATDLLPLYQPESYQFLVNFWESYKKITLQNKPNSLINGLSGDLILCCAISHYLKPSVLMEIIENLKNHLINYLQNEIETNNTSKFSIDSLMESIWALSVYEKTFPSVIDNNLVNRFFLSLAKKIDLQTYLLNNLPTHLKILLSFLNIKNTIRDWVIDFLNKFNLLDYFRSHIHGKINLCSGLSSLLDQISYLKNKNLIAIKSLDELLENIILKIGQYVKEMKKFTNFTIMTPGLMSGWSGILYQLLRYQNINNIPSLVFWDYPKLISCHRSEET